MIPEIPYRAAGTFTGEAYVERKADRALAREIRGNQRFPYVVAPRQSGKSSLLVRALEALDPQDYRGALVDLSPLPQGDYETFWRRFLLEIARSAKLSPALVDAAEPEDTFRGWLAEMPQRLVVFVDEIDALIGAPFRDLFFSKVRSLFNQRARDKELRRLQFVLAGAAHPSRLIQDQMRSPFNVGVEIALDALDVVQVRALAAHLVGAGKVVEGDVGGSIFEATAGLPFLCQLVLERLWLLTEEKPRLGVADVEVVVSEIVEAAPRDIHFTNIYEIVANDPKMLEDLGRLLQGKPILIDRARELRLSGLTDGAAPFPNQVYRRVFGRGGPLDLESSASPPLPVTAEEKPRSPAPGMAPPKPILAPAAMAAPAPAMAFSSVAMPAPPPPPLPMEALLGEGPDADLAADDSAEAEEAAPITASPPEVEKKIAAVPKLEAVEEAKKAEESESEKKEVERAVDVVAEKPKPVVMAEKKKPAPEPLKTVDIENLPLATGKREKPASRLAPVAGMLSFAAAAVVVLFMAQGDLFSTSADVFPSASPASFGSVAPFLPPATARIETTGRQPSGSGEARTKPIPSLTAEKHGDNAPVRVLDQTLVTVADYEECVESGGCEAPDLEPLCHRRSGGYADLPMNCVSYAQAASYCRFVGKSLPSDTEWERAARGKDGGKVPVALSEWTSTPGDACKGNDAACRTRIVRGSSWFDQNQGENVLARKNRAEDASSPTVGFRCGM